MPASSRTIAQLCGPDHGTTGAHLVLPMTSGGSALRYHALKNGVGAIGNRIPDELHPFIAPFDPEATLRAGVRLDYLQEREWRLPNSLTFDYANVEYVLVESIEDATWLVKQIGALRLPETKVIPMAVYRNIQQAWSDR